jgi:transcriptional regulator with XRE-family HTH domain
MPSLKEYRLQAGFSVTELARRAGVDQGTIKRAESGHPVQEVKAAAIAQALSQALNQKLSIQELGIALYS